MKYQNHGLSIPAHSHVWAFALGKASIGETLRAMAKNTFPHVTSLLNRLML
jgi:hypothetical protein